MTSAVSAVMAAEMAPIMAPVMSLPVRRKICSEVSNMASRGDYVGGEVSDRCPIG